MSSRRSRSRQSEGNSNFNNNNNNNISDDQITELVSRLQQLLPEIRDTPSHRVSASVVVQETCNYIRRLQREVGDLSERLAEILASTEANSAEAALIRSLLII